MCLILLHYCFCLQASGGLANSIYLSVAKEVEGVVCIVSMSITVTGFDTGTCSKLVGIEFEVLDSILVALT